jgi:mercuric ion binding protein
MCCTSDQDNLQSHLLDCGCSGVGCAHFPVHPAIVLLKGVISMKKVAVFLITLATVFSVPAWAATKTVTLSVPGMTCAACPVTVKKALSKVDGVEKVVVSYEKKEAIVTYEDAKTNVEALTKATENAGYPSTAKR